MQCHRLLLLLRVLSRCVLWPMQALLQRVIGLLQVMAMAMVVLLPRCDHQRLLAPPQVLSTALVASSAQDRLFQLTTLKMTAVVLLPVLSVVTMTQLMTALPLLVLVLPRCIAPVMPLLLPLRHSQARQSGPVLLGPRGRRLPRLQLWRGIVTTATTWTSTGGRQWVRRVTVARRSTTSSGTD